MGIGVWKPTTMERLGIRLSLKYYFHVPALYSVISDFSNDAVIEVLSNPVEHWVRILD
jgi:hypothetical protein